MKYEQKYHRILYGTSTKTPKLNVNRLSSICYQKNRQQTTKASSTVFMRYEDLLKEDT